MRKFEAILSKSRLTRAEAANPALGSSFFCPSEPELRKRWEELSAARQRPTEAAAGTLLLSYKSEFGGSLWLLRAQRSGSESALLGPQARRTLERVLLVVSRELPALALRPDASEWSVARVHTCGETILEGDSFGLSMCLGAAARYLQLPSPTHVAATAAIGSDGSLFGVDALREKLAVLHEWALGVTIVLTAAEQAPLATTIAQDLGAAWKIVGVHSVAEAIACAFPTWWNDLQSRWEEPGTLERLARDLHRLARDGSNRLLGWRAIADAAHAVSARLAAGSLARKDAEFATLVARRHEGEPALIPLDAEWLQSMRRPLRLRCLAHVLQSHADSAEQLDLTVLEAARQLLPSDSREDTTDDLRVIGALGRTLAAFFQYEEGERALRRAVQGWFELDRIEDASHSLSELLRVLAVTNQREDFELTVQGFVRPFLEDPSTPPISRGFVLYSLGRGFSLLGDDVQAYDYLSSSDFDWNLTPDHLRGLRLRWLIRTAHAIGDAVTSVACEKQLQALVASAPALRYTLALTQLDRALDDTTAAASGLAILSESRPVDYRRLSQASVGQDELCRRIRREFRY